MPLWRWIGGEDAHVLPVPLMNVVNGGAHAQNSLDVQEFMVVPVGAASFSEALRIGAEVFHHLRALLHERGLATASATRAASPRTSTGPSRRSRRSSRRPTAPATATGWRSRSTWRRPSSGTTGPTGSSVRAATLSTDELIELYATLCDRYPIVSIEDPLAEDEWDAWGELTRRLGDRVQLVGDDLFVTNVDRLRRGIDEGVANAILVKVNQIGTLTETLDAIELARASGYAAIISHRSGETEDTTIADLAVATDAGQIKTGAPSRTDRVAKYNQLLRIEEALGGRPSIPEPTCAPASPLDRRAGGRDRRGPGRRPRYR